MASTTSEWEQLTQEILSCKRCPLAHSRTQAVPGVGPNTARLVIIGEAPGRQEDLQGEPFVGAAGRLLTQLLEEAGIPRTTVFITNTVKCRPPDNRQPTQSEQDACRPLLIRQLAYIQPKVIALVGRVPAESLLNTAVRMGATHGQTLTQKGQAFFVMYHPAAGLYNQALVPTLQEDMQRLKQLLAEEGSLGKSEEKGQLGLGRFFSEQRE
ncbi:MAG: uracil-DNA glycosylase [Candidatus Hodarchaeota archaeon]